MKFKEFLQASREGTINESKPKDVGAYIYGNDNFMSKVKRFFTLNWIEPINASKKSGFRALKKAGFNESEIVDIRKAIHKALGEAIVKFGDSKRAKKDDSNFSGWLIDINHRASGGTFASEEIKEFVAKRVNEILSKKS